MSRLLREGGKIVYVAPSGGRDRKNSLGKVEIAPFDPASIEMFYLMANKAKTPTHFVPLALATYDLLSPPENVQKELGVLAFITIRFDEHLHLQWLFGNELRVCVERNNHRLNEVGHLATTANKLVMVLQ